MPPHPVERRHRPHRGAISARGGDVMQCGRFGADAAWFRLTVVPVPCVARPSVALGGRTVGPLAQLLLRDLVVVEDSVLPHGYRGWRVRETFFETAGGARVEPVAGYDVPHDCRFVLRVERRWAPRCEGCHAIVRGKPHENLPARRWQDMAWARRAVEIEYAPIRFACRRCDSRGVELLAFADRYQRQTRRLRQHLALHAASMPVMHVAAQHGLSWATVRRAEGAAHAR